MAFRLTPITFFVLLTSSYALGDIAHASNNPGTGASHPTVMLDDATVIGKPNGTTVQYLGIPYTQPP